MPDCTGTAPNSDAAKEAEVRADKQLSKKIETRHNYGMLRNEVRV